MTIELQTNGSLIDTDIPRNVNTWLDNRCVGGVIFQQSGCCGITDINRFNLKPKFYKPFAEQLVPALKANARSLVHITFLKVGEAKRYQHEKLMKLLLVNGWKKLGEPYLNRRYSTTKNSCHQLQTLIYIIHPKKKGNQYVA